MLTLKRMPVLFTLCFIYSSGAMAEDPFTELDRSTSSTHSGSTQWQQKRSVKAFDDFDREMRGGVLQAPQTPTHPASHTDPATLAEGSPVLVEQSPQSALSQTRRTHDFTFELAGCAHTDRDISCEVFVTSLKNDKSLVITKHTRVYDNTGNEYQPMDIKLANTELRGRWSVQKQLINGVRTRAAFVFRNVSSDTQSIAKMSIHGGSPGGRFKVEFRDIPLLTQ